MSGVAWFAAVFGALLVMLGIGAAVGLHLAEQASDLLGEDQDVGTKDG